MKDALRMIEDVTSRIDNYYSSTEGNFVDTTSKDDAEIIKDEYIEILTRIDVIELSLSLNSIQKFPEVVKCHKTLLQRFNVMESNIEFYNSQTNLGFTVISPEEAHKRYASMKKQIRENRTKLWL